MLVLCYILLKNSEALVRASVTRISVVSEQLERNIAKISQEIGVSPDNLVNLRGTVTEPMLKIPALPRAGVVYPGTSVTFYPDIFRGDQLRLSDMDATIQLVSPGYYRYTPPKVAIDPLLAPHRDFSVIGGQIVITKPEMLFTKEVVEEDIVVPFDSIRVRFGEDISVGNRFTRNGLAYTSSRPLTDYEDEIQKNVRASVIGHLQSVEAVLLGMFTRNPKIYREVEHITEEIDSA